MSPFHSKYKPSPLNFFQLMKKLLPALAVFATTVGAFAEESTGFNPATLVNGATTSVTTVVTAIGSLMTAAVALYVGFVGYRKLREGLNKA